MNPESPVWRNNFGFQVIDHDKTDDVDQLELAWCEGTSGPEDIDGGSGYEESSSHPVPAVAPETIVYRTERQALRRLPRTGAMVFT
jgi:hypothetical protein